MNLKNLAASQKYNEVVFHLEEILGVIEEVQKLALLFDSQLPVDLDSATDTLGDLNAQLFTHLVHHLKSVRRPFMEMFDGLCDQLEHD